jgi:hypothetical protein
MESSTGSSRISAYSCEYVHPLNSNGLLLFFGQSVNVEFLRIPPAQRADPSLPLFIYGHSMGGMAVLKYMQDHPHAHVDGIIIASPLLNLTKPIPWWKRQMLEYCTDLFGEFFIRCADSTCRPAAAVHLVCRGLSIYCASQHAVHR